jgi:hypothetical protein
MSHFAPNKEALYYLNTHKEIPQDMEELLARALHQ